MRAVAALALALPASMIVAQQTRPETTVVGPQPDSRPALKVLDERLPGFVPEPGRRYANVFVVAPISEDEVRLWAQLLSLSEMQLQAALAYHADYRGRDRAIRHAATPEILDLSAQYGGLGASTVIDVQIATGYPDIWPNPHDAAAIIEHAQSLDLEPDTRASLESIYRSHMDRQSSLCERMMDEVDDWMEIVAERNTMPNLQFDAFKATMSELNQARSKDATHTLGNVLTLMPVTLRAGVQTAISAHDEALSRRTPREIGASFRP